MVNYEKAIFDKKKIISKVQHDIRQLEKYPQILQIQESLRS